MATPILGTNFVEINPDLASWLNANKGTGFANPASAYQYQFGPGQVVTGQSLFDQGAKDVALNANYYMPSSGDTSKVLNTLPEYDAPNTGFENFLTLLPLAIAGGGMLAGGLGGAGAGAGIEGVAGAGAGGGFEVGAGMGGLEGFGAGAGAAGGGVTAGGFNLFDPSTWSNPFGNTPPGTTTAGQQIFGSADAGAGNGWSIDGGTGGLTGAAGTGTTGGGMEWSSIFGGGNNWMNLLGSLGGGLLQYLGADKAADAQTAYGQQALGLLAAIQAQNQANIQPWLNAGTAGLNNAGGLLGLPGYDAVDFTKTPGYEFRYQQGEDALNNRLRQAGKFYSGDAIKAGTEYGQNFATNEFTNALNRDLALAGMGQTAVGQSVGSSNNYGNNASNLLQGIGNVQGAARASGYNALAGGIGNYLNTSNQNNLLQLLLAGRGY